MDVNGAVEDKMFAVKLATHVEDLPVTMQEQSQVHSCIS